MKFHQTLRAISCVVLTAFTSLTLQPVSAALQIQRAKAASVPKSESTDEKYSRKLDEIKEQTERAKGKRKDGKPAKDEVKSIRIDKKDLEALEADIDASLDAQEQSLKARNLPQAILDRHTQAKADFKARQREFKSVLKNLEDADDKDDDTERDGSLDTIDSFFKKYQQSKTHTPTDPNKLPFRIADDKVRPPATDGKSFALGKALSKALSAAPTSEDLAQTEDVQITPAIQALADSLNKNPVKIYNWVHNNIEFLPTYGSIQGADMALQTKRGNAFDTASLLIGLLRASGVPARYVFGTIQVPADQAMNWVGGVTKPEAAQQLLGQGGIPNIGQVSGGVIKAIKLEHVWVDAFVDFIPSRGAVNKQGDTWVPMDASFKQYQYGQGIDINAAVPLDAQALANQIKSGATINETEGWVQNLNQANLLSALTNYQAQVKTYIDTTKPNATVGDVLGTKTIVQQNYSVLLGTLPYTTVATGGKVHVLPDQVRHKFQYNVYASALDRALDSPVLSFQQSLPKLTGKKITLSFTPASQADADLIASYLPKPHADGSPIQPSEFPTSLPGYLINLTAEFRVDGTVVASAGTFTMGQELVSSMGLFDPANGWSYGEDNKPTAGEYIATHVDLQGVSQTQIQGLKDKLVATKIKLETSQFAGLTKEDVTGDVLYGAILSWFAVNQVAAQISSRASNVVDYRKPSFGSFMATAQTYYWFGIPRNVKFPGVTMDVDWYTSMVVAKDNTRTVDYMRQSGMRLSAYEHLIPEKLYTDQNDPNRAQGISAVKALAIASAQGQKIFALNTTNQASHATLLAQINIDTQAKAEIQNALAAGKEVTTHASPITQNGWTGSGYIITDPATGAGAYKISGGANGGALLLLFIGALLIILGMFLIPLIAPIAAALLISAGLHAFLFGLIDYLLAGGGFDLGASFRFIALFGALLALTTATTLTAAILPIIGIIGIVYWLVTVVFALVETNTRFARTRQPQTVMAQTAVLI